MRIYISNDYNEKLLDKCLKGIKEVKEADVEVIQLDKNMLETERRALAYSKFTEDCICLFPYKVMFIREGQPVNNFKWRELI